MGLLCRDRKAARLIFRRALMGKVAGTGFDYLGRLTSREYEAFAVVEFPAAVAEIVVSSSCDENGFTTWWNRVYDKNTGEVKWLSGRVDDCKKVARALAGRHDEARCALEDYRMTVSDPEVRRRIREITFETEWDRLVSENEGYPEYKKGREFCAMFEDLELTVRVWRETMWYHKWASVVTSLSTSSW